MKMTAKKKKIVRNSLIILIACFLVGFGWAFGQFTLYPDRTYAEASVEFTFKGAAEGIAPNGIPFDTSGLSSDEVIGKALAQSGLSDRYTVDQIRDNLTVAGVYPEDIVAQMTSYESLLTGSNNEQVKALNYHPTLFRVALYNDFDSSVSASTLQDLLSALLAEFRTWFMNNYSVNLSGTEAIADVSGYDYTQQMIIIRQEINQQMRLAAEMAEKEPAFRSPEAYGGLEAGSAFDDVVAQYENLQNTDVTRIEAMISMYALSRDPDQLKRQAEDQIRQRENEKKELSAELEQVEKLIDDYVKDDILYVSTSDALQRIDSRTSQTYDQLVTLRTSLTDQIAILNTEIAQYRQRLSDFSAGEKEAAAAETAEMDSGVTEAAADAAEPVVQTEEEKQARIQRLEQQILSLQTRQASVTGDFVSMLNAYNQENLNDHTVSMSAVRYQAPKILSGAFAKRVLKTAAPVCMAGMMLCLIYIIAVQWKSRKN